MSGYRRRSGLRGADRYGPSGEGEPYDDPSYKLQQNDHPAQATTAPRTSLEQENTTSLRRDHVKSGDNDVNHHRSSRPTEDVFQDEGSVDSDGVDMSVAELLYSTSSFYAIVVPGESILFLTYSEIPM